MQILNEQYRFGKMTNDFRTSMNVDSIIRLHSAVEDLLIIHFYPKFSAIKFIS